MTMMTIIKNGQSWIILQLINTDTQSRRLPNWLIFLLVFHKELLNITYLQQEQFLTINYVVRPQLFLNIQLEYIVIGFEVLYIGFGGSMSIILRTGLLNFLFELCFGYCGIGAQIILIILVLLDQWIVLGTLNVENKNLQITINNSINKLSMIISIIIMSINQHFQAFLIIQLLCLGNSLLSIINQLYYSIYNSKELSFLIASIHSITVYVAILVIFGVENDFTMEIALFPFIFRIIYTYINIRQLKNPYKTIHDHLYNYNFESKCIQFPLPTIIEDQIIYASMLLQKQRPVTALLILQKQMIHSTILKTKQQVIIEQCLKFVQNRMQYSKQDIQLHSLIQIELNNKQISSDLVHIMTMKIKCLNRIKSGVHFKEFLKYTETLVAMENKLERYNQEYHTFKSQNVLNFFYAEIQNNFYNAQKQQRISQSISNDLLRLNNIQIIFVKYDEDLIVKNLSSNIHGLQLNQSLNAIIPAPIAKYHNQIVRQFLTKGESKYLRQFSEGFIQKADGYLLAIDLATDIQFSHQINFFAFIQPRDFQPLVIILDDEYKISCYSSSINELLNVVIPKNVVITQIIPNFSKNATLLENIEIVVNYELYLSTIHVSTTYLDQQICYSILRFSYFKRITSQQSFLTLEQEIKTPLTLKINTEDSISFRYPYDLNREIQETTMKQNDVSDQSVFKILSPIHPRLNLLRKPRFFSDDQINCPSQSKCNSFKQPIELSLNNQSSYMSSCYGLRNSRYFKRYQIFQRINSLSHSTIDRLLILLILVGISGQLLVGVIQLLQINSNLTNLVSDIDLLQIKNLVFQPMESFLLTRWAMFNYKQQYNNNEIDLQMYEQLVKYPKSNLDLGYDELSLNIKQVLNRGELQYYLQSTYLDIYQFESNSSGMLYNMSLRTSVNVLLNYQYDFKMAYQIDGTVDLYSPQAYYSYKNYLVLKNTFADLNEIILINTLQRVYVMGSELEIIFIISTCIISLFLMWSMIRVQLIFRKFTKYFNIIITSDINNIIEEIQRTELILQQITKDNGLIFKYHFLLSEYEEQINKTYDEETKSKTKHIRQKKKRNIISSFFIMFSIIILFLIAASNSVITYQLTMSYLNKYPDTAIFYKQVSDIGTDTPTLFAQREILYGRSYISYLTETDLQLIQKELDDSLLRIKQYLRIELDLTSLLISQRFQDYYKSLQQENLCEYLPENIKDRSTDICTVVMNQNLQRGLQVVLIYITNFVQTDQELNNFQFRLTNTTKSLELEGAFMISELIKQLNQDFHQDLYTFTINLLKQINIINYIIGSCIIVISILLLLYIRYFILNMHHNCQRLVYLAPRKTILLDNIFERNICALLIEDE